jgi:DNA (cytosine-5)-methyltransferase 1
MKAPNLFTIYKTMENQDKMNMQMQLNKVKTIRTVELFAGVGGFRLGLEKVKSENKNFNIVWSNQWEPSTKIQHASDVYCARFGYENHSNEDISTVNYMIFQNMIYLLEDFPVKIIL